MICCICGNWIDASEQYTDMGAMEKQADGAYHHVCLFYHNRCSSKMTYELGGILMVQTDSRMSLLEAQEAKKKLTFFTET